MNDLDILKDYCYQTLAGQLCEKYRQRDFEVMELLHNKKKSAINRRAADSRQKLVDGLYEGFDKCPLDARVTSVITFERYCIENVYIQSLEGYALPINIYRPRSQQGAPFPAIVVPIGHWPSGKCIADNQILCANFAMSGFVVATFDPPCQGERSLFPQEELAEVFGALPEDLWAVNMHMLVGNQSYLMGKNLGSFFLWDAMRVVDYLCTREDVDQNRIGATGQSGGGTQTAYLAAADDRIKVYSPIQCLSKQAMVIQKSGIGDCEQSLLGISTVEGFEYPDLLWACYPKPLMVSCGTEDFFYIEGVRQLEAEMALLYAVENNSEHFEVNAAACAHQISPQTRMFAYRWFCKMLRGQPFEGDELLTEILPKERLACLPQALKTKTALDISLALFEKEKSLRPVTDEARKHLLRQIFHVAHDSFLIEPLRNTQECQAFVLHTNENRSVGCRLYPKASIRLIVVVDCGMPAVERFLTGEESVLLLAPWGMYTAAQKTVFGYDADTRLFNAAAILGECVLEKQVNEIIAAIDYACAETGCMHVMIAGNGAGAIAAGFAAYFDERIEKTALLESQISYDDLFGHPLYFMTETSIVPSLTRVADFPHLMRAAKADVLVINPRDWMNRPVQAGEETRVPCVYAEDSVQAALSFFAE